MLIGGRASWKCLIRHFATAVKDNKEIKVNTFSITVKRSNLYKTRLIGGLPAMNLLVPCA